MVLAVNINHDPDFTEQCDETCSLARYAGYEVVEVIQVQRRHAASKTFIGKGKVEEMKSCLAFHQANAVVVNHTLSNGQHARLGIELDVELVDYSGLILTIFANRASTAEGMLQVELAQEIYGRSKLKGRWTHLERQRGGLGATGGPGESQLELDRRLTVRRISQLRKKLRKRSKHVKLASANRRKRIPTVVLVGYTNAGKTTLFTRLTGVSAPASPRLFETLSTTSRRLYLGDGIQVVLSDTVGFIRNLPHELIEAFRSTLQEALTADLALLVADISDPGIEGKLVTMQETLDTIGAGNVPCILVGNKIDKCGMRIESNGPRWDKIVGSVEVSAHSGSGVDRLRELMHHYFAPH